MVGFLALAASIVAAQQSFRSEGVDDTLGMLAWYSTDKATVSSGLYQSFQNRVGTNLVSNSAPWDGNPATNVVRALNGYSGAWTDAINDRYESTISGTRSGAFHIFLVGKLNTWTGGYQQLININEDDLRIQEDAIVSGKFNLIRKSGVSDVGFDHTSSLPTNVPFIASWEFNGASSRSFVRYNGVESVQAGAVGTNVISSTIRFPWFTGVDMTIIEYRIFNRSMTGKVETNTINRLRTKYNL